MLAGKHTYPPLCWPPPEFGSRFFLGPHKLRSPDASKMSESLQYAKTPVLLRPELSQWKVHARTSWDSRLSRDCPEGSPPCFDGWSARRLRVVERRDNGSMSERSGMMRAQRVFSLGANDI